MRLGLNYKIVWEIDENSVLKRAVKRFERDLSMTLVSVESQCLRISVVLNQMKGEAERYLIKVSEAEITIYGADDLGIIYALLFISEKFMSITPFWYWNDQEIVKRPFIEIPDKEYASGAYQFKFRGWFINDEVLLDAWGKEVVNKETGITENYAWEMTMEALLRLGGNMVIPGTDYNSHKYRDLAIDMGFWITHHHAEPLGAKMFARTYPGLTPSYREHPELFHKLWKDAIDEQKSHKTIWNLGFRGQGDKPFWDDDPYYDTPEKRGALISELIMKQYKEVEASIAEPVYCINLYGEIMELYQQGFIKLPENVIYIWADNGYGKMVSRRQGNYNPRVQALPQTKGGHHGIYYHASFYDLQAASHITMLPNSPEFVKNELEKAMEDGVEDFLVVNCSNVRPHVYMLDFIARIWGKKMAAYTSLYYSECPDIVGKLYKEYHDAMIQYGINADDRAGDQFYHYVMRGICHQWSLNKEEGAADLIWLTGNVDLDMQVSRIHKIADNGIERLESLYNHCVESQKENGSRLLKSSLCLQASIHYHSAKALLKVCKAFVFCKTGMYEAAFFELGNAIEMIELVLDDMKEADWGKWKGFYDNDCLTDVKFTIYSIESVMRFVRSIGEGPYYYEWALKYCYGKAEHKVVLITNMRNHPKDRELYGNMKTSGFRE